MSRTSRFKVTLSGFKGRELTAMDRGGTSDPYVVMDFDGFKKVKTDVIKKTLNPDWEEVRTV